MERNLIYRLAGWSAYLSGFAALLLLITAPVSRVIGLSNNYIGKIAEIVWFALIVPIAFAFHRQLRPYANMLSLITLVVGVVGLSYSTVVTFLLNYGTDSFGDNGVFLTATIGFWFLVTNSLLFLNKLQPRGLSWLGFLIGASYVLGLFGLFLKETLSFLIGIHIVIVILVYPIWAFWTGRVLLKQN